VVRTELCEAPYVEKLTFDERRDSALVQCLCTVTWAQSDSGGGAMDEVVRVVSEKTGLPPETAKVAVETVMGYLKRKLPGPIASQIEGALGNTGPSGEGGGLPGGLGQFLGGQ
jgi:hypothetical protein